MATGAKFQGWKKIATNTKTASASLTLSECGLIIASTDGITLTLPPVAESKGAHYIVKVTATHSSGVALDGYGSETIDGASTMTSIAQYAVIEVVCDGSVWHSINQNDNTDGIWTKS